MNGSKKILGIEFPKDLDAIALGAGLMFGALVLPGISTFVYDKLVTPIRALLAPRS